MCNFYTKFLRECPHLEEKITEMKKIPCKMATAVNLA